jgi:hypothetical protein
MSSVLAWRRKLRIDSETRIKLGSKGQSIVRTRRKRAERKETANLQVLGHSFKQGSGFHSPSGADAGV